MHQYVITNGSLMMKDDLLSAVGRILLDETKGIWSIERLSREQMQVHATLLTMRQELDQDPSVDTRAHARILIRFLEARGFDVQSIPEGEVSHETRPNH